MTLHLYVFLCNLSIVKISSIVSIVKCDDYSSDCVRRAVRQAIELAGLGDAFSSGSRVLLKPNLLSARDPRDAVTTHPVVVQIAGEIAISRGASVSVGDSPPFSGENPGSYAKLCDKTGMSEVAHQLGCDVVRFEENVVNVPNPQGRFFHTFEIARAAVESDIVVNIPKLKTHGLTGFSGAVKNIFGCIPGIRKGLFHAQAAEDRETFAQMLVDLLGAIRPPINILDAVVAMEGEGPNAGSPRQIGLILASSDPVALDAVACAIVGIDPMSIDTTRLADEQELGCGRLSDIEIRGAKIESVHVPDFKQSSGKNQWANIPYPIRQALRRQMVPSPKINSNICIGCGDCAKVCPVHAIQPGKPPIIDLTACIRCYCCHEVCNPHAIELKRGWLGRLLFQLRRKK